MDVELVIFDCDGVLVDSEAIVIELESALFTAAGFALTPDEIADRYVGLAYRDMMAALSSDFGRTVPDDLNARVQAEALAAFPDRLRPVEGMAELLAALTLPRCVASGSDLSRIELCLDLTGLDRFFEPGSVFSAEMVERGKPAPDLFVHVADQLGADPAGCLVVEDSPHGVAAARAAGMTVVGFLGGGHSRPSLADRLAEAGAARVITDAAQLGAHLSGKRRWAPGAS